MRWAWMIVLTLLLVPIVESDRQHLDVDGNVQPLWTLDDRSFEHDTQAATGQTAGIWLVLFIGSDCGTCVDVETTLLQLQSSQVDGDSPIVAKVNISEGTKTAKRFGVHNVPRLIYFRNQRMYPYNGQWSAVSIRSFVRDEWKIVPGHTVPFEPTFMQETQEKIWAFYTATTKYLGRRPGILACLGFVAAVGCYLLTSRVLLRQPSGPTPKRAD